MDPGLTNPPVESLSVQEVHKGNDSSPASIQRTTQPLESLPTTAESKRRLEAFFTRYDPPRVNEIDALVQRFPTTKEMWKSLYAQYNLGHDGEPVPTRLHTPTVPNSEGAIEARQDANANEIIVTARLSMPSADFRLYVQSMDSHRREFYAALESDFASYGRNLGASSTTIGLVDKHHFELPCELHFTSTILAKSALTKLRKQSAVPIPQARLAYVSMRGRPSDLQFAILADVTLKSPLEPLVPPAKGPELETPAILDFVSCVDRQNKAFPIHPSSITSPPRYSEAAPSPERIRAEERSFAADDRLAELEERERRVNARWREVTMREALVSEKLAKGNLGGSGASSPASPADGKTSQLLALRENEVYERDRQASRKEEKALERERNAEALLREVAQREYAVSERESSLRMRESQLEQREQLFLARQRTAERSPEREPSEFGKATEEYIVKLEKELNDLRKENTALRQTSSTNASVELRMQHLIERENRLQQKEAEVKALLADANEKTRESEARLQQRYADLVEREKELTSRFVESQLSHQATSFGSLQHSPVRGGNSLPEVSTRSTGYAPVTVPSSPPPKSSRADEVAAMMRRVREKEIVLRNVSEQQRLRAHASPARFQYY